MTCNCKETIRRLRGDVDEWRKRWIEACAREDALIRQLESGDKLTTEERSSALPLQPSDE